MRMLCLSIALVCGTICVAAGLHPSLDLDAARFFFEGHGHFVGNTPLGIAARYVAWYLPFALYAALVLAWLAARAGVAAFAWVPRGRAVLFLTLTFAMGPGPVLVQPIKRLTHRPRPYSVVEFGGPDRFRPLGVVDGACIRSCSFPSAETAAATWLLAPASLAPPPWRASALAAAVLFAAATGVLRMAFGGHFLSDVCGAALITSLMILAGHILLTRASTRRSP